MNKNTYITVAMVLTVFMASCACIYIRMPLLCILTLVMMFVIVGFSPLCHMRETLWTFVLTVIITLPPNLYVSWFVANRAYVHYDYPTWAALFLALVIYSVLISIEEILCGTISRIIWRKQYRVKFY